MGRLLMRVVALAVVGAVIYKGLHVVGVLGGEDAVEFEWADDAK